MKMMTAKQAYNYIKSLRKWKRKKYSKKYLLEVKENVIVLDWSLIQLEESADQYKVYRLLQPQTYESLKQKDNIVSVEFNEKVVNEQ